MRDLEYVVKSFYLPLIMRKRCKHKFSIEHILYQDKE